jgi:hypothetical protein
MQVPKCKPNTWGVTKAVLAATVIEKVICNRWEINPEYKKVFS